MTSVPNFVWTDFYMEFADKLLEHKDDRAELLAVVRNACNSKGYPYLDNCGAARDNDGELPDICPFTVMAAFNRYIGDQYKRIAIADEIGAFLDVTRPFPESLYGVPILGSPHSIFFSDRDDIEPLWTVFDAAIRLADSKVEDARQTFLESYDQVYNAHGLGRKLHTGLYWIRPRDFVHLEKSSREYIDGNLGLMPFAQSRRPTASEYINLVDLLKGHFEDPNFPIHSFQELSWKAYEEQKDPRYPELPIGLEPPNDETNPALWVVRGGTDGVFEDAALEQGLTIVGWEIWDLTKVADRDGVRELVKQVYPRRNNMSIVQITSQLAQFRFEMNEGDIVVMPMKTRAARIAIGRITGQYVFQQIDSRYCHTRLVEWVHQDVPTSAFDGIRLHRRTVSRIQDNENRQRILALLEDTPPPSCDYTLKSILQDGCFLEEPKLQTILSRLRSKKNLILQGPPGTGKTWLARRLAYALIGKNDDSRVRRLQFHPNLSYEDFIRGYRPNPDGKLDLVDGPFLKAITDAGNDPDNEYVIVIEEINRGNPVQIFGEMLTLLEADKRNPDEALTLEHNRFDDERVHIPPNLHVIGTMNVADRSIALVDLALRRRFAFIDLAPTFGGVWRNWVNDECGIPLDFLSNIENRIAALNDKIAADRSLGPQFQIGHSYLTPTERIENPIGWFTDVVETEIAPLLDEYWFDDASEAMSAKTALLDSLP